MNPEIQELFETFKQIVEEQNRKIDELTDKLNEILGGAEEAYNDWDYKNRFNDFSERNKEAGFDKYEDKLKLIQGDDFDFKKKVFDDYNAIEGDKPEEAEYVAGVIAHVADQLEQLKQAFEETTDEDIDSVEAKTEDEPGEEPATEVEAKNEEGETVAEATAEPTDEAESEDEGDSEAESAVSDDSSDERDAEPDEESEYIKELEEDAEKLKRNRIGN